MTVPPTTLRAVDTRRLTLWSLGTYLVLRLVTGIMVALASRDQVPFPAWTDESVDYLDMTVLWDGTWYRRIADGGYPTQLPVGANGLVEQNEWAFYPLFPLASRAVMAVTGLGFPLVASSLALVAGAGAAVVMAHLFARRAGTWPALAAVAVWAAFPSSPSLQLAYTESFAILFLVAFLACVDRERWLAAAGFAVVLGVTRPIAVPLAIVMGIALVVRWWHRRARPITVGEYAVGTLSLAVTGLSGLVWPVVAWRVTGERTAYTETMAAWRASHEVVPFRPWWDMSRWLLRDTDNPELWAIVLLAALAVGVVVAVAGPWARGLGVAMRTWCWAYPLYLAAVLDPFTSLVRYLLPLFPLALVLIGAGGREVRPSWRWRTVLLVGLGFVGQVLWIWGLLVFVPPSDYPP